MNVRGWNVSGEMSCTQINCDLELTSESRCGTDLNDYSSRPTVLWTEPKGDACLSASNFSELSNSVKPDFFLKIHMNRKILRDKCSS